MRKRVVILFGAGAVISWGGPTTKNLTEQLRKHHHSFICKDKICKDKKTKVTEKIYQMLLDNGYSEDNVNFETIISVIEDLIVYYSCNNDQLSLSQVFFASKLEEFINFSIDYNDSRITTKFINIKSQKQTYFIHLLSELLTYINAEISKYSYHTGSHSKIETSEKEDINDAFQKWLKSFSEDSIIRMYTLNYDRLFKILAEKAEISVFEGFDCETTPPADKMVSPNILKILSDMDSNIHYNLHGSSFWVVNPISNPGTQLPDPWITLYGAPRIDNSHPSIMQLDRGRYVLVSNIITGYQKMQKSFITPFRQMQSAFDKDCCFADEMYIIGYSFGDAHINLSIKAALKSNQSIKFHLIDPTYCEKDGCNGYNKLINIFPDFENKLTVTALKFEDFLSLP
ncbi:hypothetical protein FACS1894177_08680 [Bacteroidia bacterium]|nr:hypothetical protein FACS1894177_08680 [Bacteroidia bacterium]